jgi:hypothetical protein
MGGSHKFLPFFCVSSVHLLFFVCAFIGGAEQPHHSLIKDTVGRVSDSGTSTPTSNGDDGSRSRSNSDDATSSNPRNDGMERDVSTPNDALHLERRVYNSIVRFPL